MAAKNLWAGSGGEKPVIKGAGLRVKVQLVTLTLSQLVLRGRGLGCKVHCVYDAAKLSHSPLSLSLCLGQAALGES